jgi:hypothetical protein
VSSGLIVPALPGLGGTVLALKVQDPDVTVVYCDLGDCFISPWTYVMPGQIIAQANLRGFVHIAVRLSRFGAYQDPSSYLPYRKKADNEDDDAL